MCQSHTGRLNVFWFLLNRPKGWILMNEYIYTIYIYTVYIYIYIFRHSSEPNSVTMRMETAHYCETLEQTYPPQCRNPWSHNLKLQNRSGNNCKGRHPRLLQCNGLQLPVHSSEARRRDGAKSSLATTAVACSMDITVSCRGWNSNLAFVLKS